MSEKLIIESVINIMKIHATSLQAYNSIKIDGLLSKRRFEVYETIFELGLRNIFVEKANEIRNRIRIDNLS